MPKFLRYTIRFQVRFSADLNNSLHLCAKGVVDISINNKRRDSGRFIFNMNPSEKQAMLEDFALKCEEFFQWYSNFQNKDPKHNPTSDVKCENGCKFSAMEKFSAIGTVIDARTIKTVVDELGEKYSLKIELKL